MFRDLSEAAGYLYGDTNYAMHTVRANELGPLSEQDDLAEAWLRGDTVRVLEAVRLHDANVRARTVIVKYVSKRRRILEMRKQGCSRTVIAEACGTTRKYVLRVCRSSTPRTTSAKRSRLQALRARGLKLREISRLEGRSISTICRILKGEQ